MTTVHRLLDDAFAGIELTPDVQDLKEEIRANLEARVLELRSTGAEPDAAAEQAFDELGDVRSLVAEATDPAPGPPATSTGAAGPRTHPEPGAAQRWAQAARQNKVRPRPGFVVGIVLASVVALAALASAALGATGVADQPTAVVVAGALVAAIAVGVVVGLSLALETTANHPLPRRRAAAYGAGSALVVAGLGLAGVVALLPLEAAWYAAAAVALVAGVCWLSALGATQTNRKKAWARASAREAEADNRFARDPAAAARFGMYTAALWTLAALVYFVVSLTVGWAWSWLVFIPATAVWFLVLARMLFGDDEGGRKD